jgi:NAD(P)-dependent dehydrogenase (short-subunit alcohol dehydrogenase family)
VAVLDVDAVAAREAAAEATRLGAASALHVGVDVADETAMQAAFERCVEQLGIPTAVLANAGVEISAPAHLMALEDWQRVIAVNLTGTFTTVRLAIRELLAAESGGSIVMTSSPAAFVGHAGGGNAAYAASKGGIVAMVRSLAIDYATHGIRINSVVPGATDTPLLTVHEPGPDRLAAHAQIVDLAREQIPAGRLAASREIAAAVTWLWSEEASYVTGSNLVVDGGLLAKGANTF